MQCNSKILSTHGFIVCILFFITGFSNILNEQCIVNVNLNAIAVKQGLKR